MFIRKRKLTLEQMHELYLLMRETLPEKEEPLLIDQIDKMLENMKPMTFIKAMEIMYGKMPNTENRLRIAVMFVKGLKENKFFDYAAMIRGLGGKQ